ncbi:hypothetical protein [Halobacillus sp. H74]|uniref:hypothetical protein n=1 Tax=Halobacillus sp. H74 TaxID=3457436 RepID=UPI003FCE0601
MLHKELLYFQIHKKPIWFEVMKADVYIVMTKHNDRQYKVESHEKREAIQQLIKLIKDEHSTS